MRGGVEQHRGAVHLDRHPPGDLVGLVVLLGLVPPADRRGQQHPGQRSAGPPGRPRARWPPRRPARASPRRRSAASSASDRPGASAPAHRRRRATRRDPGPGQPDGPGQLVGQVAGVHRLGLADLDVHDARPPAPRRAAGSPSAGWCPAPRPPRPGSRPRGSRGGPPGRAARAGTGTGAVSPADCSSRGRLGAIAGSCPCSQRSPPLSRVGTHPHRPALCPSAGLNKSAGHLFTDGLRWPGSPRPLRAARRRTNGGHPWPPRPHPTPCRPSSATARRTTGWRRSRSRSRDRARSWSRSRRWASAPAT